MCLLFFCRRASAISCTTRLHEAEVEGAVDLRGSADADDGKLRLANGFIHTRGRPQQTMVLCRQQDLIQARLHDRGNPGIEGCHLLRVDVHANDGMTLGPPGIQP